MKLLRDLFFGLLYQQLKGKKVIITLTKIRLKLSVIAARSTAWLWEQILNFYFQVLSVKELALLVRAFMTDWAHWYFSPRRLELSPIITKNGISYSCFNSFSKEMKSPSLSLWRFGSSKTMDEYLHGSLSEFLECKFNNWWALTR